MKPGAILSAANKSDNFEVITMPRINLSLVSSRTHYAACTAIGAGGALIHSNDWKCTDVADNQFKPG
jgi:hypothetical protein